MAKYDQHARFAGLAGKSKYRPTEGWFDVRELRFVPAGTRRCVFFMDPKDERLVGILAAATDARVFASVVLQGKQVRFTLTGVVIGKVARGDEVEVMLDWTQMDYSIRGE